MLDSRHPSPPQDYVPHAKAFGNYPGYNLVIALVFSFEPPTHWDRTNINSTKAFL